MNFFTLHDVDFSRAMFIAANHAATLVANGSRIFSLLLPSASTKLMIELSAEVNLGGLGFRDLTNILITVKQLNFY
jgi:hypothetical protein